MAGTFHGIYFLEARHSKFNIEVKILWIFCIKKKSESELTSSVLEKKSGKTKYVNKQLVDSKPAER